MNKSTMLAFTRRVLLVSFLMLPLMLIAEQSKPGDTTEKALALPGSTAPRVLLETNMGRVVIELYPEKSPKNVANFLRYVRDGHYNGTIFHRILPDMLIQGGGFTEDLNQKPERKPVVNEAQNGLKNLRGTISAARKPSDADSAGAQFFINLVDNPQFDHSSDASAYTAGYTVIGKIVEGIKVIDEIRKIETVARAPFANGVPKTNVIIDRAAVLEPGAQ